MNCVWKGDIYPVEKWDPHKGNSFGTIVTQEELKLLGMNGEELCPECGYRTKMHGMPNHKKEELFDFFVFDLICPTTYWTVCRNKEDEIIPTDLVSMSDKHFQHHFVIINE